MPLARLTDFLDSHDIKYVVITPSVAYTAQGVAALTHISGKELAKTVIVKLDQSLAMVVVPASSQVDLTRLKTTAGGTNAALVSEHEFKDKFPDCETGAMPPFGILYDLPVFADENLTRDKEIAFNAVLIENSSEWGGMTSRGWSSPAWPGLLPGALDPPRRK